MDPETLLVELLTCLADKDMERAATAARALADRLAEGGYTMPSEELRRVLGAARRLTRTQ